MSKGSKDVKPKNDRSALEALYEDDDAPFTLEGIRENSYIGPDKHPDLDLTAYNEQDTSAWTHANVADSQDRNYKNYAVCVSYKGIRAETLPLQGVKMGGVARWSNRATNAQLYRPLAIPYHIMEELNDFATEVSKGGSCVTKYQDNYNWTTCQIYVKEKRDALPSDPESHRDAQGKVPVHDAVIQLPVLDGMGEYPMDTVNRPGINLIGNIILGAKLRVNTNIKNPSIITYNWTFTVRSFVVTGVEESTPPPAAASKDAIVTADYSNLYVDVGLLRAMNLDSQANAYEEAVRKGVVRQGRTRQAEDEERARVQASKGRERHSTADRDETHSSEGSSTSFTAVTPVIGHHSTADRTL